MLAPPSWDDFLDLALLEIIECGAAQPQIGRRLTALFNDLQVELPAERRAAIDRFRVVLDQTTRRRVDVARLPDFVVPDRQGIGGSTPCRPVPGAAGRRHRSRLERVAAEIPGHAGRPP